MESRKYVVNCKTSAYHVYIGRPGPWGNPFIIGKDGTRFEIVEKYETWLRRQEGLLKAAKIALKGKVLGCHCHPLLCHGHILAKIANEE